MIASRDRLSKLSETLSGIARQAREPAFEVIVVDDGSLQPVTETLAPAGLPVQIVRTTGIGRSASRNAGARLARANLLVFVDDDISVGNGFLYQHQVAHETWPGSVVTGALPLPAAALAIPFGQFRQALEDSGLPAGPGPVLEGIVCAAGNMSIARADFLALDGFDPLLSSAEDQDLALRHTARGGRLVYWPAAAGIHRDDALHLAAYCRRAEWGMETMVPFCRKHPDLPDNVARHRINGPLRLGGESPALSLRKAVKAVLGWPPCLASLNLVVHVAEAVAPRSRAIEPLYRMVLGVCLQRGFRRGLARYQGSRA